MDTIRLHSIEVMCILGDLPEERVKEQRIVVDVALELDLSLAASTDDLTDTVDYALLVGNIREALEESQCRLLERATEIVAGVCLEDPRVVRASVSIKKFASVPGLGCAEVKIVRPEEG